MECLCLNGCLSEATKANWVLFSKKQFTDGNEKGRTKRPHRVRSERLSSSEGCSASYLHQAIGPSPWSQDAVESMHHPN